MGYDGGKIRNIGIAAHIDAGKTTTTERILYYAGRVHRYGEVHEGTTVTDWMDQERERGITITAAATYVNWRGYKVNILDTPGHVDFTIEVERSLRVLDAVIAVFCAVGGVQSQSETVWRQANRNKIPRLCFINKMDRVGANFYGAFDEIRERLRANPVAIQLPVGSEANFTSVIDLLTMEQITWVDETGEKYERGPIPPDLVSEAEEWREKLIDEITRHSEDALKEYLENRLTLETLKAGIRKAVLRDKVTPVLCGSAFKNKGVQPLLDAVVDYLPSPLETTPAIGTDPKTGELKERPCDPDGPLAALAFKIATDQHTGKITYVRVYSGTIRKGSRVHNVRLERKERVNGILVMHANRKEPADELRAGELGALVGLKQTTTGDSLCGEKNQVLLERVYTPEPVVAIAIEPETNAEQEKLKQALKRLAEEDPTFVTKDDEETNQTIVSGMGELHLEIIVDRLLREFGVKGYIGKPQVSYKESIAQPARHEEEYVRQIGSRGQYARVVLEVSPAERTSGLSFESDEASASMLNKEFLASIERGALGGMAVGVKWHYPEIDVHVKLVDVGIHEVDSSPLAFEAAAGICTREALEKAEPVLMEPVMRIEIETPHEYVGDVIGDLNSRRGTVGSIEQRAEGIEAILGKVPLAEMFGYTTQLRSLTQGRASSIMEFHEYARVPKQIADAMLF
jgi:elongation factor G